MKQLKFENGTRAYTCEVGTAQATPGMEWWWVSISGESSRHAAFPNAKSDTAENVKARVIAYHEKLLADRARPPMPRWGRPPGSGKPKTAE